jgi:ceramide glucosyltransferase
LPIALLLFALAPVIWPALLATCVLRAFAAQATAGQVLADPLSKRRWWLIPLQDLLSFGFWIAGFFGNTIEWRGERYRLQKDGRFVR